MTLESCHLKASVDSSMLTRTISVAVVVVFACICISAGVWSQRIVVLVHLVFLEIWMGTTRTTTEPNMAPSVDDH